jgi:sulfane dehydrogenase subunit SoxC
MTHRIGHHGMANLIASRRRFLRQGTVLSMATASGALAAGAPESAPNQPPGVPQWMREQGRPVVTPPYGMPSSYEHDVVRRPTSATPTNTASWSFTPLQDLHGIITPNGLVFERHHAGVPAIDPADHRLLIHGLVEQPLILGIDDLLRFPSVSRIHFLECSGNGGTEWAKANERTVQFTHGLLSCCEWTGVPLSTVLDAAGVKREARWVLAEGADAAAMARSVPMDKALDDALLVYAQNGERLRPEQGYPLRLLLPGFEGNMSIKWLRRLEASAQPFQTREETSKYTDLLPDGKARQFTFYMEAKSVITFPSGGQKLSARGPYEIRGIAWSGHGRIRRVDVSVDGGRSWQEAQLQEPILHRALTRFRLPWRWNGGPAVLQSRSIDESGYVQPTLTQLIAARGLHSHYHNNAIQSWRVGEDGVVENVHV